MARLLSAVACFVACLPTAAIGQTAAPLHNNNDEDLKYVVYFSRHGVRSPTSKAVQYNKFSAAPWPEWDVAPGILTSHGRHLMELFGAYDRMQLASQRVLDVGGCADASRVTFYADSDQRTRETANALAKGLFPGCNVSAPPLPEGTTDPLFHLPPTNIARADTSLTTAAIAGRIGNNPDSLTEAYRAQLTVFDSILATYGKASSGPSAPRSSIFLQPYLRASGSLGRSSRTDQPRIDPCRESTTRIHTGYG